MGAGADKRQPCKVSFSLSEMGSHWPTSSSRKVLFHLRDKHTMSMSVMRKSVERDTGGKLKVIAASPRGWDRVAVVGQSDGILDVF